MAAAERPTGTSDARVPCPLCGGLIHPVAGRCKHCRERIAGLRGARPAAPAPLPPLAGGAAWPRPAAREPSQPARLPQPTGTALGERRESRRGGDAAGAARGAGAQAPLGADAPRSIWRSWPVIVIVVATLAILIAAGVLLWPAGAEVRDQHGGAPPPARERMNTDPLPPPSPSVDPWASAPDPTALRRGRPAAPSRGLGGFPGAPGAGALGGALGGASSGFAVTALAHACHVLEACPDADPTVRTVCDAVAMFPAPPPPAGCRPAQRCLDAIDHLSCSQTGFGTPDSVVAMFHDCTTAIAGC